MLDGSIQLSLSPCLTGLNTYKGSWTGLSLKAPDIIDCTTTDLVQHFKPIGYVSADEIFQQPC